MNHCPTLILIFTRFPQCKSRSTPFAPLIELSPSLSSQDRNRVFWTSSTSLRVVRKEGEDYLLPCLLTDPKATDLSLRMDNGTTVPPGMNFTVYRHRGILIHSLQPSFNADYVCTAKINGVERTSKAFSINVIQSEFT